MSEPKSHAESVEFSAIVERFILDGSIAIEPFDEADFISTNVYAAAQATRRACEVIACHPDLEAAVAKLALVDLYISNAYERGLHNDDLGQEDRYKLGLNKELRQLLGPNAPDWVTAVKDTSRSDRKARSRRRSVGRD